MHLCNVFVRTCAWPTGDTVVKEEKPFVHLGTNEELQVGVGGGVEAQMAAKPAIYWWCISCCQLHEPNVACLLFFLWFLRMVCFHTFKWLEKTERIVVLCENCKKLKLRCPHMEFH